MRARSVWLLFVQAQLIMVAYKIEVKKKKTEKKHPNNEKTSWIK